MWLPQRAVARLALLVAFSWEAGADTLQTALEELQVALADPHLLNDPDSIREAVSNAREAGATTAELLIGEGRLQQMAEVELTEAVQDGSDLDRLVAAIQRAQLDGVASSMVSGAKAVLDTLLDAALATARTAGDLRALRSVVLLAEQHGGAALATKISSAHDQVKTDVAAALTDAAGLLSTNLDRLKAAVEFGEVEGADPLSLADATALLKQHLQRAQAQEELQQSMDERDGWAVIVAVYDARRAGLSESELSAAVTLYTSLAQAAADAALQPDVDPEDIKAALQLGEAAQLPSSSLSPLRTLVALAEEDQLQTAEASKDLWAIRHAIEDGAHMDAAKISQAETSLTTMLSQKLQAIAAGTSTTSTGEMTTVIDFALHGSHSYNQLEVEQAAKVLLTSVEADLKAATTLGSLALLETATYQATASHEIVVLALGTNQTAHHEFGQIITQARGVRELMRGKAVIVEWLSEATGDPEGLADITTKAKETLKAVSTKLEAATDSDDKAQLTVAIHEAELAGLDVVDPSVLALARAKLEALNSPSPSQAPPLFTPGGTSVGRALGKDGK